MSSRFPHFWIERYGFTQWDCIQLVDIVRHGSVSQGKMPVDFVKWLVEMIDWNRERSVGSEHILKTPTGPEEIQYLYHDLSEKLQSLDQQQAREIVLYALGWQDATREASIQQIERDLDDRRKGENSD